MHTPHDSDEFWSHDDCGCGLCDSHSDGYVDDDEMYDDSYDVVMYDIDAEDNDLFALIDMLSDDARSWYARRRLNSLAASGPLSALVAAAIIDSLGRRWDPLLHPRDRFGRFINTGGFFRWLVGDTWLRGQVSRIDSDGVIHARSAGNDGVPDGTAYRFKPEHASKLVSTESPVADLTPPDLDTDIPDFPEATDIQKRIYNNLQDGDIPAVDLDRSLRGVDGIDLSVEDFTGELKALQDRGLVEITPGDPARVRRADDADLGVVDVDDIAEVPEGETPDLDDSPAFTEEQRYLLDFIADADSGEGDGVLFEELNNADEADVQALVDAGALIEGDEGRLFLENPEGEDETSAPSAPSGDISSEIFEASQVMNDEEAQEAFQHYAEELARPGEANNMPLPDGLAAAKRRTAEAAANKWWAGKNGGAPEAEAAPDADAPEADAPNPKDVLNPRNQALADQSMEGFFPGEEGATFLDSTTGERYRKAVKQLLDAEDLEESGFDTEAETERDKGLRTMRAIQVDETEIDEWLDEVKKIRSGESTDAETDVAPEDDEGALVEDVDPEAPDLDAVEGEEIEEDLELEQPPVILPGDEFDIDTPVVEDVPLDEAEVEDVVDAEPVEDAPVEGVPLDEEVLPEPDDGAPGTWEEFSDRISLESPGADVFGRVDRENRIADELGLDLRDADAPPSWDQLAESIGFGPAELLYNDTNGDIDEAITKDPNPYFLQFENDLLERFQSNPDNPGPGVMRLRQSGLIEPTEDNGWQLTDAGRERLGIASEAPEVVVPEDVTVDVPEADADVPEAVADAPDVDVPEDVPEDAPATTTDTEALFEEGRALLTKIADGGAPNRSERDLEDRLHDAGYLEEDQNGNSRLTPFGAEELIAAEDEGIGDTTPATPLPDDAADVVPDADVDIDQLLDEEEALDNAADVDVPDTDVPDADVDADVDAEVEVPDADVPDADVDVDVTDDAVPADTTDANPAPTLPNPADPNDATPGFQRTGGQGGLNAGGFYDVLEDNGPLKAGDKVYIKNGRSPEHAQNEALANRLYALAGVDVPELTLGSTGDRLVSKIVDDLRPLDIHDPADAAVLDRVRDEFAIDAWIANWDGMNPGNTLVGPNGTPYRIDVGSAMEYRAQGGLKGSAFGDSVTDIDTLRDPSMNYDTALIFGPMSDDEVAVSAARLASISPDDIRSTIASSDLPDKDALADKMVARRESVLKRFGIADPSAGDGTTTVDDAVDTDTTNVAPVARPTPAAITTAIQTGTAKQQKSRRDFASRTNPTLEVSYTNGGDLVMADGSPLDFDTFYRSGAGGEAKIGKVTEVIDQDRYPGWVKMEFLDGSEQIRHVLGTGTGAGGLRPAPEEDVDDWERQTSVTGDKATDPFDPADFPMSDGAAPNVGTRIVFDVGGEDQFGTILYINPKWDNGGRAYIVPEGGGKVQTKPVRLIRAQTQGEIDTDASPLVPYQKTTAVAQYLPQPRYSQTGALLSRMDQPVNIGDWMAQRSGGDGLVGEVVNIPDQNLWPGWVTLRFPDGEERSRHVEGFTDVGRTRGAGGLHHVSAPPDPDTWTRQRRVKGEEGEVLSYDFSTLKTLDDTPIQVGQEVFGTDRKGAPVAGLLIRINPHMKRNGDTVPTGFVWQDDREIAVDISKITNTIPPSGPVQPRVRSFTTPSTPSNVRPTRPATPRPSNVRTPSPATPAPAAPNTAPAARTPATRPPISPHNTAPAYTPNKGVALTDAELDGLDTNPSRVRTSDRTNGLDPRLAAIYEAQDFDALPLVVDQEEAARLAKEEGYVPILRSIHGGTDQRSDMEYTDTFRYGPYFAGNGIHGNGSYFAYGEHALMESSSYGPRRIYALVRPGDLKTIDKWDLTQMQRDDLRAIASAMQSLDSKSDEYAALRRREKLFSDEGRYAAAKGYDAITVRHGNSNYDNGPFPDENLSDWGYLVLLNRSAVVAVDTYFKDADDIFRKGFPEDLAPPAVEVVV